MKTSSYFKFFTLLVLQINSYSLGLTTRLPPIHHPYRIRNTHLNRIHHQHPQYHLKQVNFNYAIRNGLQQEPNESQVFKRVCYFRMDPKTDIRLLQVDGNLCTHVILAFARIDPFGNIILGSQSDENYLVEVPEFKRRYPHVKVMISIYNEAEFNGFPKAASSGENRQRLARSAMDFLHFHHLDGIDLDWEFPNFPLSLRGREHERVGLTKILKTLRSAIVENFYDRQVAQQQQQLKDGENAYQTSGRHNLGARLVEPYVLTVATAAQETVLRASYELKQMANLCDWLNIMSYDYYLFKPYAPFTGPNSPLFPIFEPYVPIVGKLSHTWTLSKLLEEGVPREKIVMGIPTYARAYRLVFKNTHPAAFTPALGAKGGRIEDYLDYREVCDMLKQPDTIVEFDARARVPYLITDNGYTWVSYENAQSVREKARHVVDNNLGGYMTWNLNSDDFLGLCSASNPMNINQHQLPPQSAAFPLHRAMLDEVSAKRRRADSFEDENQKQQQQQQPVNTRSRALIESSDYKLENSAAVVATKTSTP